MLPCHIPLPGRVRRVDETPCYYGERYVFDSDAACFRLRPRIHVCRAASALTIADTGKDIANTLSTRSLTRIVGPVPASVEPSAPTVYPCRCCLDMRALMRGVSDLPSPPLPLFRCEYHEILRSLPPRLQGYPWHLCFDTARDGFSLRNFYRSMEWAHKERMATIGLFFVTARGGNVDGRHDATMQAECASDLRDTCSTLAVGDAHCSSKPPPAAPLPHHHPSVGVIGCFMTEAPCVGVHSSRVFFGSVETFVFRLRGAARRRRAVVAHSGHRFSGRDALLAGALTPSCSPTQHCSASEAEATDDSSSSGSSSRCASPLPCAALRVVEEGRTHVVCAPRAKTLLCKYAWSGDYRNEQFVHCRHDFLGIGGGPDGAAIAVDQSLQYGTSSVYCPTFDAPALYGCPVAGLGHAEFVVLRTAWFAVCEHNDKALRAMAAMEQAQDCPCGRTQLSTLREGGLADRVVIHHCDDSGAGFFPH